MTSTRKPIKWLIAGLLLGLVLGGWFGVNVGRHKPIWSNPFSNVTVGKKIREKSGDILEKSGRMLEKKGQTLKKGRRE